MRKITCEERETEWAPKMRDKLLTVLSGSTNFMGNGLVETTWGWAENDQPALEEQTRYEPGGWPDPKRVESCQHWVYEPGDQAP